MPWSGMRRVTDASAGELVEIPKFYYKWTIDGAKMKLQISMSAFDGSYVSPAHADRGDGVGERDYVYVGRYHCASDYKSKTGLTPKVSATRATFRSGIHSLGVYNWQWDYAIYWTICMLYLVEFAHWDSQSKIGLGEADDSAGTVSKNGYSDTMPYHTGTMKNYRSIIGSGVQYRYIENLWANIYEFIDGIYFSGTSILCINNPNRFSDNTNGTFVGSRQLVSGGFTYRNIVNWTKSNVAGYEYAIFPNDMNTDFGTYVCDGRQQRGETSEVLYQGCPEYGNINTDAGLFSLSDYYARGDSWYRLGSRLMVLPPSRLSA